HFAGLQDAVNYFVSDIANVTATAGATQSLLQNCGIVIGADNDFTVDTGAVSGYNAGMGVVKNAQDIVPEDNVILSELPLPAAGSTTMHTYTGADGKTFTYTVNYPLQYLEVVDVATAPEGYNGSLDYSNAQTTYLQAGVTYNSVRGNGEIANSAVGELVAPATLNMLRGFENYWLDESLKLAYDSFGLDFDGKTLNIMFGINAPYSADTTPTEYADWEAVFPIDSINMYINAVNRANLDPSDINGKDLLKNRTYIDRVIAHEMTHAVMFAAGLFKENMPEFFTEGVAELNQGLDDYNGQDTENITELASDSERLTQALNFRSGTGTSDAYPAGFMFLRYLCHQALPTSVTIGNGAIPDLFSYTGNEEIISGEASGSQINFGAEIFGTAASAGGDDLFVNTTAGNLIIRDARGKLINFANENGTVTARSYVSDTAGTIDGRAFGEYEILFGADGLNNEIRAGDGGSQLWGGSYGSDDLNGGNGVDEFIAGVGCGNDNIFGADSNDVINLAATTLDQISSVNLSGGGIESNVHMGFTDGSSLTVWSFPNQKLNFKLSDGATYSFDTSSTQWTKTN
ncbi:MAG: hypothetical protein IKN27_06055, partial [Selenomonadaceae bacterium]|nr:hypothetical protein [Selenomonadaceae bacterium]